MTTDRAKPPSRSRRARVKAHDNPETGGPTASGAGGQGDDASHEAQQTGAQACSEAQQAGAQACSEAQQTGAQACSEAQQTGAQACSEAQQTGAQACSEAQREEYLERALRHLRGGVSERQLDEIRRQLRERWSTDPTVVALVERLGAARGPAGSKD